MRWKVRDANFSFCYFLGSVSKQSDQWSASTSTDSRIFKMHRRQSDASPFLSSMFVLPNIVLSSRCKELLGTCFAFTTLVPFVRCRCSLSSNQPPPLIKSASVFGKWSILTSDVFSTLWTPEKALHSVFSLTTTLLLVHSAPFSQTFLSTRSSFTKLPFSQNN